MLLLAILLTLMLMGRAYAHCPLCTVGVAAAAGGATLLGVNISVIGLFIGAFAVSTGWMVANLIKKSFVPMQKTLIIMGSFVFTILPISPIVGQSNVPFSVFLTGEYGTWLNTTYVFDLFIIGSIIGGLLVSLAPWLSRKITDLRKKTLPFQGVVLTLIMLLVSSALLQINL